MARLNLQVPEFLAPYHDEVRLVGHRVGLYDIVTRYNQGESAEKLALFFPTVPLALIHKVIAFYLEHQPQVDDYIREYGGELADQEARNPTQVTTQVLRRRLAGRTPAAKSSTDHPAIREEHH